MIDSLDKLVSLCKRRGFIFPSSEIYGGLASCYDYGPLGSELKINIKRAWWKEMVHAQENIYGLDSSILMHPKIWEASGHIENFTDPLVDCKSCKRRFRADHLLEANSMEPHMGKMEKSLEALKACPECGGELTPVRKFNLMFKTFMGPVEDTASQIYLRPETAQGIYVNFDLVRESMREKLPFGIAQIGKAFRNEITPGNFTFRMREFEQMEMQWFIAPEHADQAFTEWKARRMKWYTDVLGISSDSLRFRDHEKDELAHYAKAAVDIEFKYPFGFGEIEGIHNRGDWDLSRHQKFSGKSFVYSDPDTGKEYIPWIIETSGGVDRCLLATLAASYVEEKAPTAEKGETDTRVVLKIPKHLAPYQVAVLPLSKKEELAKVTKPLAASLRKRFMVDYDETQSIGRRYRRQDEIGTPYCVTVDFDSLNDKKVTVRDRDTMKQDRVAIDQLDNYLEKKFNV